MTRPLAPAPEIFAPEGIPGRLRGGVAAIGNFDGVHRGHAALLSLAVEEARERRAAPVVLTFDPHPRTFFRPGEPVFRLSPLPARARILGALGIEGVAVASFDAALAGKSASAFIDEVLVAQLGVRAVVVGFNFRFGNRRAGDVALLERAGADRGFAVREVAPVGGDGAIITSSAIRDALRRGDIAGANALLGYRWFAMGTVVRGDRRGRELGFPTANMRLWPDCGLRHGIYAVTARLADGTARDGVASFGRRPTFGDGPPLLETFLFDFEGDLYGQGLSIAFVGWVRPERRFESVDDLVAAMHGDVETARRLLASAPPPTPLDVALARPADPPPGAARRPVGL